MSFWDKALGLAKNTGTVIYNGLERSANEIRETKDKYEAMGDAELMQVLKSDGFFGKSPTEKGVAFSVLKARGYNAEDFKGR